MDRDIGNPAWPAARPLVKWTGGKSAELSAIRAAMPVRMSRLIEPFVGGGAVLFAVPASVPALANDRSADLIALYRSIAAADPSFVAALEAIEACWLGVGALGVARGATGCLSVDTDDAALVAGVAAACAPGEVLATGFAAQAATAAAVAIARKRRFIVKHAATLRGDDADLIAAAVKTGVYVAIRDAYNADNAGQDGQDPAAERHTSQTRSALFWFLREFAYGGMFRTNRRGGFNIPYGGISYNARSMAGRIAQISHSATRDRMSACRWSSCDFNDFLNAAKPEYEDFVFLDPPYDSAFSTYDGHAFTRADHSRLADCMRAMTARWMLVIAATDFVRDTYATLPQARTRAFNKTYQGHILGRNDRAATHLLITNYDTQQWVSARPEAVARGGRPAVHGQIHA